MTLLCCLEKYYELNKFVELLVDNPRRSLLMKQHYIRLLYSNTIGLMNPLEKRIAISLFALGSSVEYRIVAALFGVSIPSVSSIIMKFILIVRITLAPEYLNKNCLTQEKVVECVIGFKESNFLFKCLPALPLEWGRSCSNGYSLLIVINKNNIDVFIIFTCIYI